MQFVGVILALSGVEAIANLTGVMKLDPDSTPEHPKVAREAAKAIWPVAVEVVVGTALLGWAMLSLNPNATVMLSDGAHSMREALHLRSEDTLRFVGEQFGTQNFGPLFGQTFGWVVGIVFFFLLVSAANTAIVAMIGLLYMDLSGPDWCHRRLQRLYLSAVVLRSGKGRDLCLCQSDCGRDPRHLVRGGASYVAHDRGGSVDHRLGGNCYHHRTIKTESRAASLSRAGRSRLGTAPVRMLGNSFDVFSNIV